MDSLGRQLARHGRPLFLVALIGAFAVRAASGQTPTPLHEFSPGTGHPRAPVIEVGGVLLGTTVDGGLYGKGSIFSLTPDGLGGFVYAETHAFTGGADGANTSAALAPGPDGALYGTSPGGTAGFGVIYKVDATGNNFQIVHEFDSSEGSGPNALITASDGLMYGTMISGGPSFSGTVYSFDPVSGTVAVIHPFTGSSDGGFLFAAVLEGADGALYGTTFGGGASFSGVVFKVDKDGGNFAVLKDLDFATTGSSPSAALIQLADGSLYGTCSGGGPSFGGTVFTIQPDGSGFQVLHPFSGADGQSPQAALVQGADGLLYGTTAFNSTNAGTIFRIDASGSSFESLHTFVTAEGLFPAAGLLRAADDSLYGTNPYGGAGANGTVYELDAATGGVTVLHSFLSSDAFGPIAGLVAGPGGFLYGTTHNGGDGGYGAVYRVDSTGGSYSVLHGFDGTDGFYPPTGPLVVGSDGLLYGTTEGNGQTNFGTVYRLGPDGTGFEVLHQFSIGDGNQLLGGLIEGSDGLLYGTTIGGGDNGLGVIFRMSRSGQNFSVIHSFTDAGPQAGVLQASDGRLYGTTFYGGSGYGKVFGIDTSGANYAVLHSFNHDDGAFPAAPLIQLADGLLYGTTSSGSVNDRGVVFRLDTSGGNFGVLHEFTGPDGSFAYAPLLSASDGYLYGTTFRGGTNDAGAIYRLKPDGTDFAVQHSFDGSDGAAPFAGLSQGPDGALYGAARDGGSLGGGVAFRFGEAAAFHRLVVAKSGTGSGKVVSDPAGILCGSTCQADFASGTSLTLTPTPGANSIFVGWTGDPDCADGNVTMTGDLSCTAIFDLGPDLVVQALGGKSSAKRGTSVTLTDTTRNRGVASAGESTTQFYLSANKTLGPEDLLLASRSVPALNPGAQNRGSVVVTIPAAQAPGHYFVLAAADGSGVRTETNEANNVKSHPMHVK